MRKHRTPDPKGRYSRSEGALEFGIPSMTCCLGADEADIVIEFQLVKPEAKC